VDAATAASYRSQEGTTVKYVILIHSNPQPWGHPTQRLTDEGRAQDEEWHARADQEFEALMKEISASGEFVTAMALADPASSTLFGWRPEGHLRTDGPYAEAKEQLAGFFMIDCETRERAEEIAAVFAQPGGTVELRPSMWGDGDDQ
jgi:hypothetical protein